MLRTRRGEGKRFSGKKVIPAQMNCRDEAEPGCRGSYHGDVKTRDKVTKVGEDDFKIKSTRKASLNILEKLQMKVTRVWSSC